MTNLNAKETSRWLKALGVTGPTLILDQHRVLRNIERMVDKAERAGVRLRPHFKTHQSAGIGEWFREHLRLPGHFTG